MTAKLFDKILIANRGEIACRVIRTCNILGIKTVAVYSDADRDAVHVQIADEAVHIGPALASESYLVAEKILDAAKRTGAKAIHPGYGFLSENAAFAEACQKAKIAFIGPPADAIRAMGLKGAAKSLMEAADVPVVPGYHGKKQDLATLKKAAGKIGYPLLIKAVAGGGGKGMRKVASAREFEDALNSARREAKSAFGDQTVLIEKLIEVPRHIEIQVFADAKGNAVHLFERDCSLQRRHQKVVEEAPAPGMPPDLRAKMGDAAVAAAKAIGYQGAGTVEFIVDVKDGLKDAPFYFMEMNTRLQVEHPVTEMITGQDLVEWQILAAAGHVLPLDQDDLFIDGHAVEVRLYAEDPDNDFLPASGRLQLFDYPLYDDDIRVDSGVKAGDEITTYYDPMIAKIIAYGEDRSEAIGKMQQALEETAIAGLTTNLGFLRRIMTNKAFRKGALDTGFIPRHADDLMPKKAPLSAESYALASLAVIASRQVENPASPWDEAAGWRLNLPYQEQFLFLNEEKEDVAVNASGADNCFQLTVGSKTFTGALFEIFQDQVTLSLDGIRFTVTANVTPEQVTIVRDGVTLVLNRHSLRTDAAGDAEGPGAIITPMPGRILDVMVKNGDAVKNGAPLLILEAMKMEHTLTAPRAGTVAGLAAKAGDQVTESTLLLKIEDEA